ncbi:hypothetical protein RAAC3_TM7C00001G0142 [Candidatus Saccharibacteria bacterium RAAC3_TM7_1]|nr:hypothetical protein RAAC3_TM7C00001G0142 [Candidatus Saccharibacteria bacterium RAAC3_TM7_1]HCZ28847.1 hypothetical protein [Candidatus Saccharibacteria bacterium]
MIIVWVLSWWYGAGWKAHIVRVRERLARTMDYFSINLLVRTLFAPYRQIAAGKVDGPIGLKLRAFVDRLISRFIGAFVRGFIILVGSVWLGVQALFGIVSIAIWAVVPLLPIVGFIAAIAGWAPRWT